MVFKLNPIQEIWRSVSFSLPTSFVASSIARGFTHNWMSVIVGGGSGMSNIFKSLRMNPGYQYILLSHKSPWYPPHFLMSRFSNFRIFNLWWFLKIWLGYRGKWSWSTLKPPRIWDNKIKVSISCYQMNLHDNLHKSSYLDYPHSDF